MVWAICSHSEGESVCTAFLKSKMAIYQNFPILLQIYAQKYFSTCIKIYITGCSLLHICSRKKMEITKYPKIREWLNKHGMSLL